MKKKGSPTRQTKEWDELAAAVEKYRLWVADQVRLGMNPRKEWVRSHLGSKLLAYCNHIARIMSCRGYDPDLLDSELALAAFNVMEGLDPSYDTAEILSRIASRVRGAVLDAGRTQRKSSSNMGRNVARYERQFKAAVAAAEAVRGTLPDSEKDLLCRKIVPETSLSSTWLAVRYSGAPEQVMPEQFGLIGQEESDPFDDEVVSALHMRLLDSPDTELRTALVEYMDASDHPSLPKLPNLQDRLAELGEKLSSVIAEP
jgi:hypothetical protein